MGLIHGFCIAETNKVSVSTNLFHVPLFRGYQTPEFQERHVLALQYINEGKGKTIRNRPGQALRVPGASDPQISRHSAHKGGKVVSPTHRPYLPPRNISGTHFC